MDFWKPLREAETNKKKFGLTRPNIMISKERNKERNKERKERSKRKKMLLCYYFI